MTTDVTPTAGRDEGSSKRQSFGGNHSLLPRERLRASGIPSHADRHNRASPPANSCGFQPRLVLPPPAGGGLRGTDVGVTVRTEVETDDVVVVTVMVAPGRSTVIVEPGPGTVVVVVAVLVTVRVVG
jgi:hypothetical protein